MTALMVIFFFAVIALIACIKLELPIWLFIVVLPIISAISYGTFTGATYVAAYDTELWNGTISDKPHITKDCPHGWGSEDDFCTEYTTRSVQTGQTCSGSGSNQVCTQQYETQYHYDYPWEGKWYLKSDNLNNVWYVERVDAQGALEPPFWSKVHIGDPASITNGYSNWVRAASDSLFAQDGKLVEKYRGHIPDYPGVLHDMFKVDRLLTVGFQMPEDLRLKFTDKLSRALSVLGPNRQMNAIVILADTKVAPSMDYAYAVRRAWQGFKKNDAVIFIGLQDGKINWSEVLSWSKNAAFNVEMRDAILADQGQPVDLNKVIQSLSEIGMKDYSRRAMAEFEYLKDDIPIPISAYLMAVLFNTLALVGIWLGWSYLERNHYV